MSGLIFGSPAARDIVEADRKLQKLEQAVATAKRLGFRLYTVTAERTQEGWAIVAARDEAEARRVAGELDEWHWTDGWGDSDGADMVTGARLRTKEGLEDQLSPAEIRDSLAAAGVDIDEDARPGPAPLLGVVGGGQESVVGGAA